MLATPSTLEGTWVLQTPCSCVLGMILQTICDYISEKPQMFVFLFLLWEFDFKYHLDEHISNATRTITTQSTVYSHMFCYSL